MSIDWRVLPLVCEAAVYLYAGLCIWLRRREGQKKQETLNCWPLALFFLVCGLVFAVLTILFWEGWFLVFFSLPVAYVSILVSSQRISWDTNGFWYRTAMRREIRYEYGDISGMRRVGPDIYSRDLLFHAGRRLIILDHMQGWTGFEAAYDNWRTRSGMVPYREEERQRWMERYMRHGVFARNLDRIWGGRFLLILSLVCGALLIAFGAVIMATARTYPHLHTKFIALAVFFMAAGIAFPAIYIWGVAHMNKRVLRFYTRNRIRPDPLNSKKPKQYRKKHS